MEPRAGGRGAAPAPPGRRGVGTYGPCSALPLPAPPLPRRTAESRFYQQIRVNGMALRALLSLSAPGPESPIRVTYPSHLSGSTCIRSAAESRPRRRRSGCTAHHCRSFGKATARETGTRRQEHSWGVCEKRAHVPPVPGRDTALRGTREPRVRLSPKAAD